jgi:hypothetical protein
VGDLTTLWPVLGGGGIFGVLAIVIVAQMRSQATAATQHAKNAKEAAERAAKAIKDAEDRADAAEERERQQRERSAEREAKLQAQYDEALTARRRAEDLHAQVILEVRRLQYKVDHLEAQLKLYAQTTGAVES